jgi:nucleotide-binding universal stress UspA family protein
MSWFRYRCHPGSHKRGSAMIKDIVVNLSVGKPRDVAGEFAVSVAVLFDAHLAAVAVAHEPPITSVSDGVSRGILSTYRTEQKTRAERAGQAILERARLSGVGCDTRILTNTVTDAAKAFGVIARNYDLSVVAQGEADDDMAETLVVESALFDSGRPVLVVPYIQATGLQLDRVMVCWDGSRSAARAVGDALPLLKKAGKIEVVTVEDKDRRNELRGAQIAEHLARHKLKVELKPIVAPDSDAADVILSQAADSATDLVVMGGYGHSRLREFVLGGMTRGMLGSMTVPVLMSH